MAKRMAPSSAGPNADSPARIAGKAEAQATMVTATAIAVVVSNGRETGLPADMADMCKTPGVNGLQVAPGRAD